MLRALAELYDDLCRDPESGVCPPGWSPAKVSAALCLDEKGALSGIYPLKDSVTRGKKTVELPRIMMVPQQQKRASNVCANFLCDTSSYLLGVDEKGKPERTGKCFEASRTRHLELLGQATGACAKAICSFYESWDPEQAAENPILQPYWKELVAGGANMVFRVQSLDAPQDPEIRELWQAGQEQPTEGDTAICLVTGKRAVPARLHPNLKGVSGAQSSGAALVSFNAPAFCSYGKEQSYNAPVSEAAVNAYGTALNYLLADREHVRQLGDTTVVYWAKGGQAEYQNIFAAGWDGSEEGLFDEGDLKSMMEHISKGKYYDCGNMRIDPDADFYILGLSPNAARVSVRFFYHNSFAEIMRNLQNHYRRLEIVRPKYDQRERLTPRQLLYETVNKNERNPTPSPVLAGALMRAILQGTRYPAALLQATMLRIHAEQNVSRGQAAIIKAVLLQKQENSSNRAKEEITVELNENTNYTPYLLGRAFALLEEIQYAANPNLNATIKDRYFNAASTTPAVVFPKLMQLHNNHLKVLERTKPGLATVLEIKLSKLCARTTESYPAYLQMEDQGIFILGYYHQKQADFDTKKEETKNV